ncbi:class I adenylate-forming enzyme family protein [Microbispora sp. NPDC049125]|uniref:class I adenylate-forming enzyme family protein n=1 Tax=Microbispora sp. NPDC049125 TaxID=3154929 RepID=UPI0034655437
MTETYLRPARPASPDAGTGERVHDLLAGAAATWPSATAVRDARGAWTYAGLDAESRAVAAWLAGQGVGPGERVLVRIGNRREVAAILYGLARLGAVFVPINPAMKRFHLERIFHDAEPVLAVTADAEAGALREFATCPVHGVDALWSALDRTAVPPVVDVPAGDVAQLIYTSGSTSLPKAVVSPHRAVTFAARAIGRRLGYRQGDVVFTAVPLSFDYGLYQIFLATLAGAELFVAPDAAQPRLLSLIRQAGATVVPLVPSLGEMLIRLSARGGGPTAVRMFTNTGAALTPPVIAGLRAAFPGAGIVPMYGITECKRATILEPDGDLVRPGSVGTALPGTEVLILDAEGRPLPPGEVGEIAVRGPNVMDGYWRAPEMTAQRFRADETTGEVTFHTGDYGRMDRDGHLYFEGRRDDMFKRRGTRMSVIEIEAAALDVPGVTAAAVLPPEGTRDLVMYATGDITGEALLRRLAERLEDAKVPAECHILPALPLTDNGKVDKRTLQLRTAIEPI